VFIPAQVATPPGGSFGGEADSYFKKRRINAHLIKKVNVGRIS